MTPHWLMPVIHSQSSMGISPTVPPTATPALLMRRSTPESHAVESAWSRFMSWRRETSQRSVRAVPPRSVTSFAVSASPASSTSPRKRRAPRAASSSANARPRPEAAPVRTHEGEGGSMRGMVADEGRSVDPFSAATREGSVAGVRLVPFSR